MADLTVKETVYRSMIHYPSLYYDKGDVFDHLFLAIGNGYEWENGGLVDIKQLDDQPVWADESGDPPQGEKSYLDQYLRAGRILHAKRRNNQVRFVLDNFDAIFDEPMRLRDPSANICQYSALFNMPDDVRPDWRKACNDTSRALNGWIHQFNLVRMQDQVPEIIRRNAEFRAKHFAEDDARWADFAASIPKNP